MDEDCEQSAQTPLAKNRFGSSSSNVLATRELILESDIRNHETRLKKQFIGNKASAKDIQQAAFLSGKATELTLLKTDAQMEAVQSDIRKGSRTKKNARMEVEVTPKVNSHSLLTEQMLYMSFPYIIYLLCYRNA